ncbi:MAG: response regulator [Magnetococcus sp. YQC-3]
MNVLIVDDSPVIRQLIMKMLKPYGFAFTEAANGVEAVAKFSAALPGPGKFDLVLMDIEMPEMDGQQALKMIRMMEKRVYGPTLSTNRYACIIMITSLDDPQNLIESYKSGKCNGYLTKPVDPDDLLDKLRRNHIINGTRPVDLSGSRTKAHAPARVCLLTE